MLEILALLFLGVSIHFITLVFHNKQKANLKNFYKATVRIVGAVGCLIFALMLAKPWLDNRIDQALVLCALVFLVFKVFFVNDYKSEK